MQFLKDIEVSDGIVWLHCYDHAGRRTYFNFLQLGPLAWCIKRAHRILDKHIKSMSENL